MKHMNILFHKVMNISILLGEEHPYPGLTVKYVVRLGDALIVWGPAIAMVGILTFYDLYR